MTNPNLSEIVLIVDGSGSMSHLRSKTIEQISSFIREQKEVPGEAHFTYVWFNTKIERRIERRILSEVEPKQRYETLGGTALYDALGSTIDFIGDELSRLPENERPANVIICTISDGEENSSNEYTYIRLEAMIKRQKEIYNWHFLYLGSDLKAVATSRTLGLQAMAYSPNEAGTEEAYRIMSSTTKNWRTGK